jgi:hypothetical protein
LSPAAHAPAQLWRRWSPLGLSLALVLAGHAYLLGWIGLPRRADTVVHAPSLPPQAWRLVAAPAPARPPTPAPAPRAAPPAAPLPDTLPDTPAAAAPASTAAAPPAAASAPVLLQVPALLELPIAGEGQISYDFALDGESGQALLRWAVEQGRYRLDLERRVGDRELPSWHSEGLVGPQGLQPLRHAEQRRGRDRQAINFRRDEGLISYSASPRLQALPAGVQDRLSWWIQLSAMVAAEPSLEPGLRLVIPVAALKGGVQDWVFELVEQQGALWRVRRQLAAGEQRPELQWELWLDSRRAYLPVRLRFSLDDAARWEMQLSQ